MRVTSSSNEFRPDKGEHISRGQPVTLVGDSNLRAVKIRRTKSSNATAILAILNCSAAADAPAWSRF